MILVWNDANSFRRHLEAMSAFRQAHGPSPANLQLLKDMPVPCYDNPSRSGSRITCFTSARGRVVIAPIWKMKVPPGAQN
jgi:hypothetical protein